MTVIKINKSNSHKICVIKGQIKLENYKNCLGATQLKNEINHQEKKKKIDVDGLIKDHKEFIKDNNLELKIIFTAKALKRRA